MKKSKYLEELKGLKEFVSSQGQKVSGGDEGDGLAVWCYSDCNHNSYYSVFPTETGCCAATHDRGSWKRICDTSTTGQCPRCT